MSLFISDCRMAITPFPPGIRAQLDDGHGTEIDAGLAFLATGLPDGTAIRQGDALPGADAYAGSTGSAAGVKDKSLMAGPDPRQVDVVAKGANEGQGLRTDTVSATANVPHQAHQPNNFH